jgi:hypothetical protein
MSIYPYLSIYLSIYGSTAPVDLGRFSVSYLYTVGRTPWTGDQPAQGRYLHTGRNKQNKRTQTSVPRVGLEPMIPVFERAKPVHTLERAATVIGIRCLLSSNYSPVAVTERSEA